jgi:hypothetical protein
LLHDPCRLGPYLTDGNRDWSRTNRVDGMGEFRSIVRRSK